MSVSDDRASLHVRTSVEATRADVVRVVLGVPPSDPATYFSYFGDVRVTDLDGSELTHDRVGPGVLRVSGAETGFHLDYTVRAGDMQASWGESIRVPRVDRSGSILPLRTFLAVVETEAGETVEMSSAFLTVEDGEKPVHVPWKPSDGVSVFEGVEAARTLYEGVVVSGPATMIDAREDEVPLRLVVRTGDEASGEEHVSRVDARVRALVRDAAMRFGVSDLKPLTVVAEVGSAAHDVVGLGTFVHVSCPSAFLLATPIELAPGTQALDFHRRLAHEIYHRWVGNSGLMRPDAVEVLWLSEGAAEYFALLALARSGLVTPETTLALLADRARELAASPLRARGIDEGADAYASDGAYRRVLHLKAPLVCFLLDTHVLESERPIDFDVVMKFLLISSLMKRPPTFTTETLGSTLGRFIEGDAAAVVQRYVDEPIADALRERAERVGLLWGTDDEDPTIVLTTEATFRRRLAR